MNLPQAFSLPLVEREMRVLARGKRLFLMRTFLVALMMVPSLGWVAATSGGGAPWFGFLGSMIFYILMLITPMLAAGCISTERENGTLGLLFLSPMRSFDIIAAKFASNFLQLFAVAIAGVPVLAGTLVMGGVTTEQVSGAALSLLALLIGMLSVTVFVSAISVRTRSAVVLSYLLVFFIQFGVPLMPGLVPLPDWVLQLSAAKAMTMQMSWSGANNLAWAGWTFVMACVQAVFFLGVASWWVPRTLASEGQESKATWRIRRAIGRRMGFAKRFGDWLRNRNPLLWLEWRRVSLVASVTALLVAVGGAVLAFWWTVPKSEPMMEPFYALCWGIPVHILVGVMAIGSICRSVMEERREPTTELLRCAPLDVGAYVRAKFAGAWMRYGILYAAVGVPSLVMAFRALPQASSEEDMLWFGLIVVEFIEDFSFMCMLFATTYTVALRSNSLSNALVTAMAFVWGVILGWACLAGYMGAILAIVLATVGIGSVGWVIGALMFILKIVMEWMIFRHQMQNLSHPLSERVAEVMRST